MERWVLSIDSRLERFEMMQTEWIKYHTYVQTAVDMPQALEYLLKRDFLLVTIAGETVEYMPLLKLMREMKPMPILVLAPTYNAEEKIEAIRRGADEYIEWPDTVEERLASARALIRRYTELNHMKPQKVTTITYKDLLMAVEFRKVFVKSKEVKLTKGDFDLLYLLLSHPGRVYTFEQIYSHLYGDNEDSLAGNVTNAVRCQINRVRKKLKVSPDTTDYIQSVRDVGYSIAVSFADVAI